jgi:tRNA A37 threonylcarbamoyladenosine biosynthesis protein TsaE
VVEWPERIEPILPSKRIWVWLEYEAEEHRLMRFSAHGERYENMLITFRKTVLGAV